MVKAFCVLLDGQNDEVAFQIRNVIQTGLQHGLELAPQQQVGECRGNPARGQQEHRPASAPRCEGGVRKENTQGQAATRGDAFGSFPTTPRCVSGEYRGKEATAAHIAFVPATEAPTQSSFTRAEEEAEESKAKREEERAGEEGGKEGGRFSPSYAQAGPSEIPNAWTSFLPDGIEDFQPCDSDAADLDTKLSNEFKQHQPSELSATISAIVAEKVCGSDAAVAGARFFDVATPKAATPRGGADFGKRGSAVVKPAPQSESEDHLWQGKEVSNQHHDWPADLEVPKTQSESEDHLWQRKEVSNQRHGWPADLEGRAGSEEAVRRAQAASPLPGPAQRTPQVEHASENLKNESPVAKEAQASLEVENKKHVGSNFKAAEFYKIHEEDGAAEQEETASETTSEEEAAPVVSFTGEGATVEDEDEDDGPAWPGGARFFPTSFLREKGMVAYIKDQKGSSIDPMRIQGGKIRTGRAPPDGSDLRLEGFRPATTKTTKSKNTSPTEGVAATVATLPNGLEEAINKVVSQLKSGSITHERAIADSEAVLRAFGQLAEA